MAEIKRDISKFYSLKTNCSDVIQGISMEGKNVAS